MTADEHIRLIRRLSDLKLRPDCIRHLDGVLVASDPPRRLSLFGIHPTNEFLLEVTDGTSVRVNSFLSKRRDLTPDERRKELPLVDEVEAHAIARRMCLWWPRQPLPPGVTKGYRD